MQCNCVALAARLAGTLLAALALTLMAAGTAAASGSTERADRILIPSAGWNGRAIQEPHDHDVVPTSVADRRIPGWSAGPVAFGAGYHRPGGSARVREVQRRLSRLGYHVGPIDGLFGRLTRASVAWFQVKHGLEVNGLATLGTVRHLRARTGAGGGREKTGTEPGAGSNDAPAASRPTAWEAFNQLVDPTPVVDDGSSGRESGSWRQILLVALVAANVLLLIALLLQRRSRPITDVAPVPADAPLVPAPHEHRDEPQPRAAEEDRPKRRFAPPQPAVEDRPPGRVPIGKRNDEPVPRHE
jgi:peptidoglycan hydrolase-like protein with peptidoglycan-binding domain